MSLTGWPVRSRRTSDTRHRRREAPAKPGGKPNDPITAATMYPRYRDFLKPRDRIVLESGSSSSGIVPLPLPDGAEVQLQPLWGSIGWATGATLGIALADPSRRTVLFTGEGSHQMTAADVGTMGRNGLKPVIFVLNNEGYMVERALEANPDWVYNDLAPWNYHALPAALGCRGWFTAKVTTLGELDAALARAATGESASYIEVVGGRMDFPAGLAMAHRAPRRPVREWLEPSLRSIRAPRSARWPYDRHESCSDATRVTAFGKTLRHLADRPGSHLTSPRGATMKIGRQRLIARGALAALALAAMWGIGGHRAVALAADGDEAEYTFGRPVKDGEQTYDWYRKT